MDRAHEDQVALDIEDGAAEYECCNQECKQEAHSTVVREARREPCAQALSPLPNPVVSHQFQACEQDHDNDDDSEDNPAA